MKEKEPRWLHRGMAGEDTKSPKAHIHRHSGAEPYQAVIPAPVQDPQLILPSGSAGAAGQPSISPSVPSQMEDEQFKE